MFQFVRLFVLSFVMVFFVSDGAIAACAKHSLAGIWEARSYTKFSPKRIEIIHNCGASRYSKLARGKSEWVLRVFSHCIPRNCIWGRANAKRYLAGVFEAQFETFAARRTLKIIPMGYKLEVHYTIDYRSELRKDLKGRVYLTR